MLCYNLFVFKSEKLIFKFWGQNRRRNYRAKAKTSLAKRQAKSTAFTAHPTRRGINLVRNYGRRVCHRFWRRILALAFFLFFSFLITFSIKPTTPTCIKPTSFPSYHFCFHYFPSDCFMFINPDNFCCSIHRFFYISCFLTSSYFPLSTISQSREC